MSLEGLKSDWKETDKVLVAVELGIVLAAGFMGFQFMQYHDALTEEGCRYYYSNHVEDFEFFEGGEFLNRTEYLERRRSGVSGGFQQPN